ncbi:MAG: A/G-specific adenine glycosylase [Candidatus Limnocylindrales bacterium]
MKVSTHSGADGPGTGGSWPFEDAPLRRFQQALLDWYGSRARPLRIRRTRDAWAVLVSEVMAQQTQIARVDEAWACFMERYPTPRSLARASTADVLRAWAGLGYNRRARNLQLAAVAIVADHAGRVPRTIPDLEALPGVGPYTARAVAAIAFGRPVAAVDTNVTRVVTRVSGSTLPPRALQEAADALVDHADPARWTYASMELGATVCTARRPRCPDCPVAAWCASAGMVVIPERRTRPTEPAFEASSRWLRGRIIAYLRALDGQEWGSLPTSIGVHGADDIEAAVAALQREGLLERGPDGVVRLPSG